MDGENRATTTTIHCSRGSIMHLSDATRIHKRNMDHSNNKWLASDNPIDLSGNRCCCTIHTHTYRLTNNVLSKMPVSIAAAHRPYSI